MAAPKINPAVVLQVTAQLFMGRNRPEEGWPSKNYKIPGTNGKTYLDAELSECAGIAWKMAQAVEDATPTDDHKI